MGRAGRHGNGFGIPRVDARGFITSLEWEMRGRRETPGLPVAGTAMPSTNINGNLSRRTDSFSEDGEFELFPGKYQKFISGI